jgi:TatD DNase family protein
MLTDAHCHPFDLAQLFPGAEEQRRLLGVMCAASASDMREFEYNETISHNAKTEKAPPLLPCFALHPQMPLVRAANGSGLRNGLAALESLARQGRLAAIGETGFDLYNAAFRKTEQAQDELFAVHLETALRCDLPLVIHARRAMHKIFARTAALKKCRAVIFHSWPGTAGEGGALLKRGVNAFFSFGATVMCNHREAMRCAAIFPPERLLTETDAPYQPPREKKYSSWEDLPRILETLALLRREAGSPAQEPAELEHAIEANFRAVFGA